MKKIILFSLLLLLSATTFSQQTTTATSLTKTDYLRKSKNQKTAAWVLLGAGSACLAIAAPGNVSFDILPALVIGGGGMVVASIPLFIASGKNKKKAMNMSFRFQHTPVPQGMGFAEKKIPSLSLSLHL
ncbi:MAG: hypothetical protein ACRDEB_10025 [Chitinophagaceae bacterium]